MSNIFWFQLLKLKYLLLLYVISDSNKCFGFGLFGK